MQRVAGESKRILLTEGTVSSTSKVTSDAIGVTGKTVQIRCGPAAVTGDDELQNATDILGRRS